MKMCSKSSVLRKVLKCVLNTLMRPIMYCVIFVMFLLPSKSISLLLKMSGSYKGIKNVNSSGSILFLVLWPIL